LGVEADRCSVELLVHNPKNAVTAGVWRIRAGKQRAILKVLTSARTAETEAWASTDLPSHWNYWRREALFYQSELPSMLADAGLGAPRMLGLFERSAGEVALWLEDVQGKRGDVWELEDHRAAAQALGRAHGVALQSHHLAELPWLSRRFLRGYSDKSVPWSLLEDDAVWRHPLVAECLGDRVRSAGRQLVAERGWLLTLMEELPRTLCHLDFWPMNLIRRPNGEVVALDWAFVGEGAIGEDLGNHVPDSAFDLFTPADQLPALDRATFRAFVTGAREAGWEGDEQVARLGVCASAVKYAWLLPLMLERALRGEHASYGGVPLSDPRPQYRQRGETLGFLATWVDEARRIAH
jgi:hypothetical protein